MDDLIVAAIRRRLKTTVTDLGGSSPSRLKPADLADITSDERRLGFALPPLMKRLYTEIGNGGFGPGYGLIGLTNGVPDDTGKAGPAIYEQLRSSRSDWDWPIGLLPICHWGCAIMSCVDCAAPNFRMRIFDPNVHDGDDWADAFFEECVSFESWIGAWASGVDLWELTYGEKGHVFQILSARYPKP
jgi:SMI1/KNR4 family protein SUKH-1